jgi:hypothetical protein
MLQYDFLQPPGNGNLVAKGIYWLPGQRFALHKYAFYDRVAVQK